MSRQFKVLVINPGSTSTKMSIFHGEVEILTKNVEHSWQELKEYSLFDQTPFRESEILRFLSENHYDISEIDAVVSRGTTLVNPVVCGLYAVNEKLLEDAIKGTRNHPCSLGPFIADSIAKKTHAKAFMIHPANIEEHCTLATFSGLKGLQRDSKYHVENHKAVGQAAAKMLGKLYEETDLIVAHLGGGISICAHHGGKCIDSVSANKSTGPFSGRRTGGLSPWQMMDICFAEGMTKDRVEEILMKSGGLLSYLGTDDCIEIERRIDSGDDYAALVYEAMAYRISKEIASFAPVFKGKLDAICLTGGMAHSKMLCRWIKERVGFIAPVMLFPGSLEQESMNQYVQRALVGQEEVHIYH